MKKISEILNQLPELEGTEKQIKWATDIRAKAIEVFKKEAEIFDTEEFEQKYAEWIEKGKEYLFKAYDIYVNDVINQKSAAEWIDNRYVFGELDVVTESILRDAKEEAKNCRFLRIMSYIRNKYIRN